MITASFEVDDGCAQGTQFANCACIVSSRSMISIVEIADRLLHGRHFAWRGARPMLPLEPE